MADPLSDDEFSELLRAETDSFRLIIRGWAAVEADLNTLTVEAFEYPWEGKFNGIYVKHRIAIAAALGILTPSIATAINKLAELRNQFAHGTQPDLSADQAAQLRDAFGDWLNDEIRTTLDALAPHYTVVYVLNVARAALRYGADSARKAREARIHDDVLRRVIARRIAELRAPESNT